MILGGTIVSGKSLVFVTVFGAYMPRFQGPSTRLSVTCWGSKERYGTRCRHHLVRNHQNWSTGTCRPVLTPATDAPPLPRPDAPLDDDEDGAPVAAPMRRPPRCCGCRRCSEEDDRADDFLSPPPPPPASWVGLASVVAVARQAACRHATTPVSCLGDIRSSAGGGA